MKLPKIPVPSFLKRGGGEKKTNVIYYFSATGNSLAVARGLVTELGEEDTELIAVKDAVKQEAIETDAAVVGIVYPVYDRGQPLIVCDFVGKLAVREDAHVYAVATYGGMPGAALRQTRDELAARDIELAGGWGVRMPGNFVPLYNPPGPDKARKMCEKAALKVREIGSKIRNRVREDPEASFFLVNWVFSGILHKRFIRNFREADKNFWVDDNCIHCGSCANVCPVANIEMVQGVPAWKHRCEFCMACIHWCPTASIQYGKRTKKRRRYHHPDATVGDFLG